MLYSVRGYIKKEEIKLKKEFTSLAKANSYIDKMLYKYDCQVQDEYVENNQCKYFCEDNSSFIVESKSI